MGCDDEVYRALSHPIRRNIICYLCKKKHASFKELLGHVGIHDHGKLGYHVRALENLIRYNSSRRSYCLSRKGRLAAELILETRLNLIEMIRFTEKLTTKIYGLQDEAEVYETVREEFEKSGHYMCILLLKDEKFKLRLIETSFPLVHLNARLKATTIPLKGYEIELDRCRICNQVVREGKTVQVKTSEIVTELFPSPISAQLSKTMDLDGPFIATPLKKYGDIIGIFTMSSTNLSDYFSASVGNLSWHISNALELADQRAMCNRMEGGYVRKKGILNAIPLPA